MPYGSPCHAIKCGLAAQDASPPFRFFLRHLKFLSFHCHLFVYFSSTACIRRASCGHGPATGRATAPRTTATHTHRSHTMEEDLGAIFKNPKTNSRWELPATPRWAPHPMVRTAQSKRSDKTRCLTFCHALSSTGVDKKLKQRGQKVKQRVCGPPPGQKLCPTRGILGLHC